jgi:hypothetical protein
MEKNVNGNVCVDAGKQRLAVVNDTLLLLLHEEGTFSLYIYKYGELKADT